MIAIQTYIRSLPERESAYAQQYWNWRRNLRYARPVSRALDCIVALEIETNIDRLYGEI